MTIYIESFLIQNILIDFCLLRLVKITTNSKTSTLRLIISSIIGAGFSVFSVVCLKNTFLLNIVKMICAFTMLNLAFKQSKKQFIFNFILLFAYTYALGGALTSLSASVYNTSFGVIMSSKLSLEIITICIIIASFIIEYLIRYLSVKVKTNSLIYTLTMYLGNKSLTVNAYLDTGNLLSYNGEPVIVIDLDTYLKLTDSNILDYYLKDSCDMAVNTVSGCKKQKIFALDSIEIKQHGKKKCFEKTYVTVNPSNSFKHTNYEALLSPALI